MSAKQKIVSLFAALALVVSLCAVVAVPAGADVSQPQVTLNNKLAGANNVTYTIKFVTTKALGNTDVIVITFPAGTGLADLDAVNDVTVEGSNPDTVPQVVGNTVYIDVPNALSGINALTVVDVAFAAGVVDNPGIPGAKTLTVYTSQETTPVTSAEYVIEGFVFDPAQAALGETVTAYGAGFAANQTVWIYVDANDNDNLDPGETVLATTAADDAGVFSTTLTVTENMEQAAGILDARDGAGTNKDGPTFTILASISVDTPSIPRGGTIQFDGVSFAKPAAATDIKVRFDAVSPAWNDTGEDLAANATSFTDATTQVPFNAPLGTQIITCWVDADNDGIKDDDESATATIEVTASTLNLSPISGPVGQTVVVSGSNLAPNWLYAIWFDTNNDDAVAAAELLDKTTSDESGNLSLTFEVPAGAVAGVDLDVALVADDDNDGKVGVAETKVAFATFSLPGVAVTLSPTEGVAGTTVSVTGTGFPKYSKVILWLDLNNNGVMDAAEPDLSPAPSILTDALGSFSGTFVIPGVAPNQTYKVAVNIGGTVATADLKVTKAAITVATALKSIEAKYEKVWGFDAATQSWKVYDPAAPEVSDLASLEQGKGYWIKVSEDCTLIYGGNTYNLKAGWNLIGWLG